MKKRMFLTTVLMTLVLLLAVTTATFAWYQATAGQTTVTGDSFQITTSDKTLQLGAVEIKLEFGEPSSTEKGYGPVSATGEVKFNSSEEDNGDIVSSIAKAPYDVMGNVTYTISASGAGMDAVAVQDALRAYAGEELTVTLAGTNLRLVVAGEAPAGGYVPAQVPSNLQIVVVIQADGTLRAKQGSLAGTVYFSVVETVTEKSTQCVVSGTFNRETLGE